MKVQLALCAFAAALLSACSGGGGSSSSSSVPRTASHTVGFTKQTIADIGHRSAQSGSGCPAVSPIALQADPATPLSATHYFWWGGYTITATEYDASCSPVTATPTYVITDSTMVTSTAPAYMNIGTAPAGSLNLTGLKAGLTSVTAAFPDGTSALIQVGVYGTMGVSCSPGLYGVFDGVNAQQSAIAAWSATSGYAPPSDNENLAIDCDKTATFTPAPAPDNEDIQTDDTDGGVKFPYGYDVIAAASTLGGMPQPLTTLQAIATCASFTSQGTVLTDAAIQTAGVILFKTSTGACVKFAVQSDVEQTAINGGILNGHTLVGFYAVSDSSGNFSY